MIGHQLVPQLLQQGHTKVTVLSRGNRRPRYLRDVYHVVCDRQRLTTKDVPGTFDAVIDNVAYTPEDAQTVLQVLEGQIGQYVAISTAFVYPGLPAVTMGTLEIMSEEWFPQHAAPTAHEVGWHAQYVQGKRALEAYLVDFAQTRQDLGISIIRPGLQIMGPHTDDGRFAWFWLRVQDKGPIWIAAEHRWLLGPCQVSYSGDVAKVLIGVACVNQPGIRAYHAIQPELWSIEEYLLMMASILEVRLDIRYAPSSVLNKSLFADQGTYRQPLPYRLALSTERTSRELGMTWTPMITWMKTTGQWVSEYYRREIPAWYAHRNQELRFSYPDS